MKLVQTIELPVNCESTFDVIADIERYPSFLPHWRHAQVLRRESDRLLVEQSVQAGPMRLRFRSMATLSAPRAIEITSEDPPFNRLLINWRVEPKTAGSCRLELRVQLTMAVGIFNRPLRSLFSQPGQHLITLFDQRIRALHPREQSLRKPATM